jgi:hypothetical protein
MQTKECETCGGTGDHGVEPESGCLYACYACGCTGRVPFGVHAQIVEKYGAVEDPLPASAKNALLALQGNYRLLETDDCWGCPPLAEAGFSLVEKSDAGPVDHDGETPDWFELWQKGDRYVLYYPELMAGKYTKCRWDFEKVPA